MSYRLVVWFCGVSGLSFCVFLLIDFSSGYMFFPRIYLEARKGLAWLPLSCHQPHHGHHENHPPATVWSSSRLSSSSVVSSKSSFFSLKLSRSNYLRSSIEMLKPSSLAIGTTLAQVVLSAFTAEPIFLCNVVSDMTRSMNALSCSADITVFCIFFTLAEVLIFFKAQFCLENF